MPFSPRQQDGDFAKNLIKYHDQLWIKQSGWRTSGEQIRQLVLPNHREIDQYNMTQGHERTDRVYSSTATIAAPRLAAHLAGNVTPSRIPFFGFSAPVRSVSDLDQSSKDWLQDESNALYSSLQNSNFFGEMLKDWLSLVVYGTSIVMSDEHPQVKGGFWFHTDPYGSYVIDEKFDGTLARIDRKLEWSLSKVVSKWGLQALHPMWQNEFKNNPFMDVKLIHIIKEADELDHQKGVPGNRKVASYYIDKEHNHIIEIGSFHEMPSHLGRWWQAAGEDLGRGPGHDVLADIRSDNEISRLGLNNLALGTFPPMIGRHQGVIGTPSLRPASMNWVMQQGDLIPWQNTARLDIQQYGQEQLKASINRAFFQDLINVTNQQPQGKTPISATQINANIEIMLPIIGPYLSKMEHEKLVPMLNRCFQIRQRAGLVSPPPQQLLDLLSVRGGIINLEIKGPISKAIKKVSLDSLDAVVTRVNSVSPVYPNMPKMISETRLLQMWVEGENAPQEMLKTEEELQAQLEQEQAALQQQQEDQSVMQASEAAKNMAPMMQGEQGG